jgi:hypothetical protein
MTPDRKAAVVALVLITLTFGIGGALLGEVFGSSGDSDQTFIDHVASSRNRGIDIAGSALLIAAGVAFLVLVAAMRRLLAPADLLAGDLFVVLGFAVSVLLIIGGTLFLTTPFSITFGGAFSDDGQFDGGHAAVLPQAATFLVAFGAMPTAAFAIVSLNLANRGRTLFPRWHTVVGWVCAFLLLLSLLGVGMLALPVWCAATAVALGRAR